MSFKELPSDFGDWLEGLDAKVKHACGSSGYHLKDAAFFRDDLRLSVDSVSSASKDALANYLTSSGSMPSYLATKWVSLTVFALGFILLMAGIAASFLFGERKLRGEGRKRKMKIEQMGALGRLRLYSGSVVLCVVLVGGVICNLIFSSQAVAAYSASECNAWQLFLSHYAGAGNISRGVYTEVSTNWLGSENMQKELAELLDRTVPGEENKLAADLRSAVEDLKRRVIAYNETMLGLLTDIEEIVETHEAEVKAINALVLEDWEWDGYKSESGMRLPLTDVFVKKAYNFVHEINDTINLTWPTVSDLIDKYTDENSVIMPAAHTAVYDTIETVDYISRSFGAMVVLWNSVQFALTAAVVGVGASFQIFVSVLILVCVLLALYCSIRLSVVLHADRPAIWTSSLTQWRVTYILCALATGFAAFAGGYQFLLTSISADVCNLVDQDLLTDGRWELLPKSVSRPLIRTDDQTAAYDENGAQSGTSTTGRLDISKEINVPFVFNVCLRRGGTGAIGNDLGLDRPIAELRSDVEDALTYINTTISDLVKIPKNTIRVKVLRFLVHEILRSVSQTTFWDVTGKKHYGAENAGRPSFDKVRAMSLETYDSAATGRRGVLGLVPHWNEGLVQQVMAEGVSNTIASVRDGYDLANRLLAAAAANRRRLSAADVTSRRRLSDADTTDADADATDADADASDADEVLVERLCGPLYGCEDETATDISTMSSAEVQSLAQAVAANVEQFEYVREKIEDRTVLLLELLRYMERYAQWEVQTDAFKARSDCLTYNECRALDVERLDQLNERFFAAYSALTESITSFLSETTEPMIMELPDRAEALIKKSNCQSDGTLLDYTVYAPMCKLVVPSLRINAFVAFLSTAFMALLTLNVGSWLNYLYRQTDRVRRMCSDASDFSSFDPDSHTLVASAPV